MATQFQGYGCISSLLLSLLAACSNPGPGDAATGASTLYFQSSAFYQELLSLPASGDGSLEAFYTRVAGLSFAQYFTEQLAAATDAVIVLDGVTLPNPKAALLAQKSWFLSTGEQYATVGSWWQASGFVGPHFASEDDYKKAIFTAFEVDASSDAESMGLTDKGGPSVCTLVAGFAAATLTRGTQPVTRPTPAPSARSSRGGIPLPVGTAQRFGLRPHTNPGAAGQASQARVTEEAEALRGTAFLMQSSQETFSGPLDDREHTPQFYLNHRDQLVEDMLSEAGECPAAKGP